ncbi:hypothetical protein DFH28DRAFT_445229 [Melampsora americana]|nr:hypothetical protein DFH28DRAFT_445229 [Melampsora americana]
MKTNSIKHYPTSTTNQIRMSTIPFSFQSEENQHFNLPSSTNQSSTNHNNLSIQSTSTLVSCVFCIDASIRQRINWNSFGIQYINAFIRKLVILYPDARMRFIPVLFNSLPPTTPASLSVYQPIPFSDLATFINSLPTLLPGSLPEINLSNQSPQLDSSDDYQLYGGTEPAILEAIVRAMELMDQKFSPISISLFWFSSFGA